MQERREHTNITSANDTDTAGGFGSNEIIVSRDDWAVNARFGGFWSARLCIIQESGETRGNSIFGVCRKK